MNKFKNCLIQAKLLWFLNEKKKRENVIFFVCKQIPEEIKQKNSLAMLSVLKRFSRIFSVRLKNNGYTIWFTSNETFYVISVNVQVTSISDSIDLTLPSQFVGSETTTHLIIHLLHHVFHFQSLCWLNI